MAAVKPIAILASAAVSSASATASVPATASTLATASAQSGSSLQVAADAPRPKRKRKRKPRVAPAPEFNPEPEPAVAEDPGETRIVVSRADRKLYLYKDGELVRTFKVGVGKHRGSTPAGRFRIVGKAHNPVWSYKGKHVPGGIAANPLGKYWMGLSVTHKSGTRFGIHGTNAPWSIGGNVSRGCIRMYNKDAAKLFRQVSAGTPVVIY